MGGRGGEEEEEEGGRAGWSCGVGRRGFVLGSGSVGTRTYPSQQLGGMEASWGRIYKVVMVVSAIALEEVMIVVGKMSGNQGFEALG